MSVDILDRKFFERKPEIVAREILGKLLVRRVAEKYRLGIIVETEAYLGLGDNASHSSKGRTKRNEPMFGSAGHSYIYFTYGMHWMLNFVTEKKGVPSAVLIRAIEPLWPTSNSQKQMTKISELRKFSAGPARLTKWMGINGSLNDTDVTQSDELFVAKKIHIGDSEFLGQVVSDKDIVFAPRVGIDYAGKHKELPLRFFIKNNPFVSKRG